MRRMLISSIAVGVGALLVCLFTEIAVFSAAGEAERLRGETVTLVLEGRSGEARERLTQLAHHWKSYQALLETISSHDDLHQVTSGIMDARAAMDLGDAEDLVRTLELLGSSLEHITSVQALSLSNLY